MGAAESTEQEPPGIATAMMRLKSQKSAGEISEQVFDAGVCLRAYECMCMM